MAVFKVFYQHNRDEVIVRENTQSLYVESSNRRTSTSLLERS